MNSGSSEYPKAIQRRRLRLYLAGCGLLVAVAASLSAQAMAAKPQPGTCWGTCGGDRGPVGGYFVVANDKVKGFLIVEGCLGKVNNGEKSEVAGVPDMKIDDSGKFSFSGSAKRTTNSGEVPLRITLKGKFVSRTKAKISLKIDYDNCGTKHVTIVRHG